MSTFECLVVESAAHDQPIVEEAVGVLQWAAQAGPFAAQVRVERVDPNAALPGPLRSAARRANAVMLAGFEPQPGRRIQAALRHAIDAYASVRHVGRDGSQESVIVAAPSGTTAPRLGRVLAEAFFMAERRGRSLAYAPSPAPARAQMWQEAIETMQARFRWVCAEPVTANRATALAADGAVDVLVTDMPLDEVSSERSLSPTCTAWLGTAGAVYVPQPAGDDVASRLAAALRCVATVIEHSAARYGLAESIRRATAETLREPADEGAGSMGQAVLDHLHAGFRPCAGW